MKRLLLCSGVNGSMRGLEAMRRFAEHERTNNADMVGIMEAMSPAEREAMARYISGL